MELSAIYNFIEKMEGQPHLVGFFGDNIVMARAIDFIFLLWDYTTVRPAFTFFPQNPENGTSEDIKNQMVDHLKVEFDETDERLQRLMQGFHVYNVDPALNDPEGEIKATWRIIGNALKRAGNPPYRLVGHVYRSIASKEDILKDTWPWRNHSMRDSSLCREQSCAIITGEQ